MRTQRFEFRAPPERMAKLKQLADQMGISQSGVLNLVIDAAEANAGALLNLTALRQKNSVVQVSRTAHDAFSGN